MSPNLKNKFFEAKIISGKNLGKTIGYPTINLDRPEILKGKKRGVYLCRVFFGNKNYFGLLYFGPRLVLKEKKIILEIYIIDFNEEIYGETIRFSLLNYIRGIMDFADMNELKKQINNDFAKVRKMIK